MKYIALLREINGGNIRRVEMKQLKILIESFGYANVLTYINSGNIIFESDIKQTALRKIIETNLKREFGFDIPVDSDSPSFRFMGFVKTFENESFKFIKKAGTRRKVMIYALINERGIT
jgi:hypothetical protein